MPRISGWLEPFDAGGGFNVNEIAGALAWVCPLLFGMAFYFWRKVRKVAFVITFCLFGGAFLALFLGQSRFALAGVLVALVGMVGLLIPERRARWAAWVGLLVITVLEIMIVRNVFTPPGMQTLAERDEDSMSTRFDIWTSAIQIIGDYPLTGVGLNMFRDGRVRSLYPVPTFKQSVLPHTHQEWLQIGTDVGLPGLAVYLIIQGVVAWMLYRGYRQGDTASKALFVGVAGGLFAHAVFGLGDAIPIWDRFAFIFWWLIALGTAQYFLTQQNVAKTDVDSGKI
jgi:putative inorganic carbon (HCO3(-)) transporter